jgi:hypothetical protein
VRPGTLRAYAFGVFTGSLMTATLTMCSAPAKADATDSDILTHVAAVCTTLADYATPNGVYGIGSAIMEYGYTAEEAGQIIAGSVIHGCPQYIPLLKRIAAANQDYA